MRRCVPLVALALWASVVAAAAQTAAGAASAPAAAPERPFDIQLGVGGTLPIFGTRGEIGPGWNVAVGGTFWVQGGDLGIRGEYLYSRFASRDKTFQTTPALESPQGAPVTITAREQVHVWSAHVSWRHTLPTGEPFHLFAGPSLVHRRVSMRGTGEGQVVACTPIWLECAPTAVTFDAAIGVRHTNNLGVTLGGGTTFDIGLTTKLSTELRYVHAGGPEFTDTTGTKRKAGVHLLMATVGLRF